MIKNRLEFAGTKLHEIVQISKINNSILPSRENFTRSTPSHNGSIYAGFKYGERIISVDIGIPTTNREDLGEAVYRLAYALDVKSPSKLVINDSDIVYYAVPDGSTDLNRLFHTGTATINFVCHDPLGYQDGWSGCIMSYDDKTFLFDDMGTYSSYPVFGFKFFKPSSFIYLTNEKSESILIGNPKNNTVETVPYKPVIVGDDCTDSSTFTDGGNVTVSNNRVVDGNYGVGNNGNSIVATSYGTDVDKKWVGTTFRKNLGQNLEEFEVRVNLTFSSHGENYTPLKPKDLVRVIRKSGTYMYKNEASTDTIIQLVPYETNLNIQAFGKNETCKVTYNGKTGWISTRDVGRITINTKSKTMANARANAAKKADEQMGLVEAMGYDKNGQLLFRFHMRDDSNCFEHNIPEVYIKDKLYLHSNTKTPTPNTVVDKNEEGKPVGEVEIPSGAYGKWNDFTGTFCIRRKKLENGKFRWWARISRTETGANITQEIHMGGGVINDNLPKGELNHIVFYIAKYSGAEPVSLMAVNHVTVVDISNEDNPGQQIINYEIFQPGDHIEIDCEKCTITLNDIDLMDRLDIGSTFFSVNRGSKVVVKSEDDELTSGCSYRKRYL